MLGRLSILTQPVPDLKRMTVASERRGYKFGPGTKRKRRAGELESYCLETQESFGTERESRVKRSPAMEKTPVPHGQESLRVSLRRQETRSRVVRSVVSGSQRAWLQIPADILSLFLCKMKRMIVPSS